MHSVSAFILGDYFAEQEIYLSSTSVDIAIGAGIALGLIGVCLIYSGMPHYHNHEEVDETAFGEDLGYMIDISHDPDVI